MPPPDAADPQQPPILALDTASPTVSVALGRVVAQAGGGPAAVTVLTERSVEIRRSSEHLLRLVREVLDEAGVELSSLGGVLALRGPGSFTGLRVGLATVLGLHQALGVPATAVPTLPVLATAGGRAQPGSDGPVAAVVDALRGEWFTQVFPEGGGGEPAGEPEILGPADLASLAPAVVVGFGARRLAEDPQWPEGVRICEPEVLAPAALEHAALTWRAAPPSSWDPRALTSPLYLRPPAVTPPKKVHPHGATGG